MVSLKLLAIIEFVWAMTVAALPVNEGGRGVDDWRPLKRPGESVEHYREMMESMDRNERRIPRYRTRPLAGENAEEYWRRQDALEAEMAAQVEVEFEECIRKKVLWKSPGRKRIVS